MLHRRFKPTKCKTALKLTVSRIKLLNNKRAAQVNQLKRELALLLGSGQDHTAMIRVEHVVREQKTIAAYELVEIYCDLIVGRLTIIDSQKNCPIDLKEAISSAIFASPRCADIPELADVRKQFLRKYGKDFVSAAVELRPDCGVSRLLVEKLSARAPDACAKLKILSTIADEHGVQWDSNSFAEKSMKLPEDRLGGPNTVEQSKFPGEIPASATRNSCSSTPEKSSPGTQRTGKQHLYGEEKGGFSQQDGQNWAMDFKDATAAAHVAAESAERASFAARAAARLSSQGRMVSTNSRMDRGDNDEEKQAGVAERFSNLKSSSSQVQAQLSSSSLSDGSDSEPDNGSSSRVRSHGLEDDNEFMTSRKKTHQDSNERSPEYNKNQDSSFDESGHGSPTSEALAHGALSATFDDSGGSNSEHEDESHGPPPLLQEWIHEDEPHCLQQESDDRKWPEHSFGPTKALPVLRDLGPQASSRSLVEDDVQEDRFLNYGNLTGGLRNKVGKHQPHLHGNQPDKLKQEVAYVASSSIVDSAAHVGMQIPYFDSDDDDGEQVPKHQPHLHGNQPDKLKQEVADVASSSIVDSAVHVRTEVTYFDSDDDGEQVPRAGSGPVWKQDRHPHQMPSNTTSRRTKSTALEEDDSIAEAQSSATGGSCSDGGNSLVKGSANQASHVHPNLPDYDDFAAYFRTLRETQ